MSKKIIVVNGGHVYCDGELCGTEITIKTYLHYEETNSYNVVFSFLDEYKREEVIIETEKGKLTAKKLQTLMTDRGGLNSNHKVMFQHFNNLDAEAVNARIKAVSSFDGGKVDLAGNLIPAQIAQFPEVENVHETVGWYEDKGEEVFFCANKIVAGGKVEESKYKGTMEITPRGSFEVYKQMLKESVLGYVPLEAIISVSGSATILGFAKTVWSESIDNSLLHIYSDTTEGKSTASELYASLGGVPECKDGKAVFTTFDGTNASLKKKFGGNSGYPVVIDEFSHSSKKSISELLYALSGGRDKERLNSGGKGLQKLEKFTTMILTNGEESILKKCNGNGGLRVRVFEMMGIKWTKSAEHAEGITSVVRKNYGHVTPLIAKALLNDAGGKWYERFKYWKNRYLAKAKADRTAIGTTERVSKTLALYMVSADILEEVLEVKFKKDGIFEFFYKKILVNLAEDANIGVRAYNWIRDYFIENKSNFLVQETCCWDDMHCPSTADGIIKYMRKAEEIEIMEEGESKRIIFDRTICLTKANADSILKKGGFSDVSVCMKAIKSMGLLMVDNNETLVAKFSVNNESCYGYRIKIPQETFDFLRNVSIEKNNT